MFNQNKFRMKRLSLVLISLSLAVSGLFTSCEEDTDTSFDKPTIEVLLDGSAVTGDIQKPEGTALNFEVKFSMGAAEDKLTKIRITSTIGGKTFNVVDSVLDQGIFNSGDEEFVYTYKTSVGTSEEKISFYTEDTKSRTQEEVVTIKPQTVAPVGEFVVREAILMGSYANATLGSCYSFDLNKVLTLSAGFSQQSAVDLFYFYGSTNKATLSAPSNTADLGQVFTNATTGIAKWTTKNATKLKEVTGVDFANLTVTAFDAAVASMGTEIKVNNLAVGDVLAIETAGTKKALVKVDQITEGSAGSIKITIKMKK